MSRTLHVVNTTVKEVAEHWGWDPTELSAYLRTLIGPVYVRCTRKGHVNWDKAPIYKHEELIERNNVIILNSDGTRKHQWSNRTRKATAR